MTAGERGSEESVSHYYNNNPPEHAWFDLQKQCLSRDEGKCQVCAQTGEYHTIWVDNPNSLEAGYGVDNMQTRCPDHLREGDPFELTAYTKPETVDVDESQENTTSNQTQTTQNQTNGQSHNQPQGHEIEISKVISRETFDEFIEYDTPKEGAAKVTHPEDGRKYAIPSTGIRRFGFNPSYWDLHHTYTTAKGVAALAGLSLGIITVYGLGLSMVQSESAGFGFLANVFESLGATMGDVFTTPLLFAAVILLPYLVSLVYRDHHENRYVVERDPQSFSGRPGTRIVKGVGATVATVVAHGVITYTDTITGTLGDAGAMFLPLVYAVVGLYTVMSLGDALVQDQKECAEQVYTFAWDFVARFGLILGVLSFMTSSLGVAVRLIPVAVSLVYLARRRAFTRRPKKGNMTYEPDGVLEKARYKLNSLGFSRD